MRDRRNSLQYGQPPHQRADNSQRNIFIAVGLFVPTLVVVGILLLSGGDDDPEPGLTVNIASPTPSITSASSTATPSATATVPVAVATATGAATPAPSATNTTVQPTPTDAPVEEPTETPTAEEEPTEEPTATELPTEEPTATATREPAVGEFGPLPPAQVVSGSQSRPMNLDYELAVSLDAMPTSGPVYLIDWGVWTSEQVTTVASRLGIEAPVSGSSGNYQVVSDTGEIYFSGNVVQYVNKRTPVGGTLEDNATVIENARVWLSSSGITGGDIGAGTIIGRDDSTMRAVVLFKPVEPTPLLAFYPSATVTIGPGGDVREANIRWPDGYAVSDYDMRPANQIWNDVLAGEGSIDADLSSVPGSGPVNGTFTISDISTAYSFASGSSGEYLVPLIVFSGEIHDNESGVAIPASVYIQGVYGQVAPRG